MAKLNKADLSTVISNTIYTNTSRNIKGNTARDRYLDIAESSLNAIDDLNSPEGYLGIDTDGIVDVSFIKAPSPIGYFLRDDGTWAIGSGVDILVTSNIIAENDCSYSIVSSSIFTDPSPVTGKGYTVILNTIQTATVGGIAYGGITGQVLKRYYNGSIWVTRSYYSNTANLAIYESLVNKTSSYTLSSLTTYPNTKALVDGLAIKENLLNKGAANGYAPLNASALIDSAYLPAYVDDIVEGYLLTGIFYEDIAHTLPITGLASVIYIDLTAGQSSKQYRWSGSVYIQITNGLIASTSDVPEGSNLYFTNTRALSAAPAETASSIATINHTTSAKTTLVDTDELTGQDSASSFSLIRVTCLNIYNYLKTKFDLIYSPVILRGYVSGGNFTTTSLTLVNITGLSVALEANTVYEINIKMTVESSSNAGLNTGVDFSAAGATIEAGEIGARDVEVGKACRLNNFNTAHAASAWVRLSNTPQTHEIKGIVRTGANAGNLTAQILKVISGTATVYVDSYIKAQKA